MQIVRLSGGLGNQLFQYAFGRQLARRHPDRTVVFDVLNLRSPKHYRPYFLPGLGLDPPLAQGRDVKRLGGLEPWWRPWCPRLHRWPPTVRHGVSPWTYEADILDEDGDRYLIGYWQSPRYLEGLEDELRAGIVCPEPLLPREAEVLSRVNSCESVSVHVRRGDYLNSQNSHHGVCSLDYFHQAIKCLRDRLCEPNVFVFSDDPVWTRDRLRLDLPSEMVSRLGPDRSLQEFWIMSRCRHNIIANSTFSWWSAWLNGHGDKLVVAPQRWMAGRRGYDGIFPSTWIKL